jgi:hypothetical protein
MSPYPRYGRVEREGDRALGLCAHFEVVDDQRGLLLIVHVKACVLTDRTQAAIRARQLGIV